MVHINERVKLLYVRDGCAEVDHKNERPVALRFLSSQKAENIRPSLRAFYLVHIRWDRIDFCFVDNNHDEIRAIEANFPEPRILFCDGT